MDSCFLLLILSFVHCILPVYNSPLNLFFLFSWFYLDFRASFYRANVRTNFINFFSHKRVKTTNFEKETPVLDRRRSGHITCPVTGFAILYCRYAYTFMHKVNTVLIVLQSYYNFCSFLPLKNENLQMHYNFLTSFRSQRKVENMSKNVKIIFHYDFFMYRWIEWGISRKQKL